MVEYRQVIYEECLGCNACNLCEVADEHREKDGYSKIGLGSKECKECKREYEQKDAP